MAGTQSSSASTFSPVWNWRKTGSIAVAMALVLGALAYGYLHRPAPPVGERGDRIEFSSLATVVSLEDYAKSDLRALGSEAKDDRLSVDLLPVVLASTNSAKTDLHADTAELTKLIAQHAAKLHQHLEAGLGPRIENVGLAARADSPHLHATNSVGAMAISSTLQRTEENLTRSLSATSRSTARGGVGASITSRGGAARRGGLTGLAN